jgi:hypothetical protein
MIGSVAFLLAGAAALRGADTPADDGVAQNATDPQGAYLSPPAPKPAAIERVAKAFISLRRRHEQRDDFDKTLRNLQRAGLMTVVGEEGILAAVDACLGEADAILERVNQDATAIQHELDELEVVLNRLEWDVLVAARPQLDAKRVHQDAAIRASHADVDQWNAKLEPLRRDIDLALVVRAPVARERALLDKMTGLVAASERALSDHRYADVAEPIRRLSETESPAALAERVQRKTQDAHRFSGQADVLLLRTDAEGMHSYTVLLRTPGEPGSHGINIQDSSCLVQQDREYIRAVIGQITRAVDATIIRQFRLTSGSPTEPPSEPPPSPNPALAARDLAAAAPPPAEERRTRQDLSSLIGDVGNVMFRLTMPDRMRQYLATTPCSLTITTDDLELPWELMYDDSLEGSDAEAGLGFLCLQRPIARMPMGRAFPRVRPVKRRKSKLRFLLVYADPEDNLPAAQSEVDQIKRELELWSEPEGGLEVETLRGAESTGTRMNRALLSGEYDVIHFAGHAHFSEADPDLSGLVLHGQERFLSQKIQRFVEGEPLVFLNACQTGRTANANTPQSVGEYFWKPAEGLASAFLYGGALGCVGSLWPVYDDPAAEFAVEFYKQVLEGQPIGEAMRLTRRAIRSRFPDSITWAAFVLYGDPTFRLIR